MRYPVRAALLITSIVVTALLVVAPPASADWGDLQYQSQTVKYGGKVRGASQFVKGSYESGCPERRKMTLRVYDYSKDGHSVAAEFRKKIDGKFVLRQININSRGGDAGPEHWDNLCLSAGTWSVRTCVVESRPYQRLACSGYRYFAVVNH